MASPLSGFSERADLRVKYVIDSVKLGTALGDTQGGEVDPLQLVWH